MQGDSPAPPYRARVPIWRGLPQHWIWLDGGWRPFHAIIRHPNVLTWCTFGIQPTEDWNDTSGSFRGSNGNFRLRFQAINPSSSFHRHLTALCSSGIPDGRLMRAARNPCFRLLGLPVEIVENVVLCLPAPAMLGLRVVRVFQCQTRISALITIFRALS